MGARKPPWIKNLRPRVTKPPAQPLVKPIVTPNLKYLMTVLPGPLSEAMDYLYIDHIRQEAPAAPVVSKTALEEAEHAKTVFRREFLWKLYRGLLQETKKHTTLRNYIRSEVSRGRVATGPSVELRLREGWMLLKNLQNRREDLSYIDTLERRLWVQSRSRSMRMFVRELKKPTKGPIPGASLTRGTLTGEIMQATKFNLPMPRMVPQPHAISMIIHKRWKVYTKMSQVLSLFKDYKSNPNDKLLKKMVQTPQFKDLLARARKVHANAAKRERTPIPPELLVRCAKHKLARHRYRSFKKMLGAINPRRLMGGRRGLDAGIHESGRVEYIDEGQMEKEGNVLKLGNGLGWVKP
ncbi:hypothetical protein [Phaffia rhodozyma]|uniref:Uncharacterized protein n=1 Tax=Phaffia rhodozyma TaxID=264483 RepID=A0A0F7SIH1_PHARH|nr:hypothetical protein [Phaffia rhodozyma]